MVPDPRTERRGICRAMTIGGTGIEWVCIKLVHAPDDGKIYGARRGVIPTADRHYYVPRYPNRST
jgi:hypothetical protein